MLLIFHPTGPYICAEWDLVSKRFGFCVTIDTFTRVSTRIMNNTNSQVLSVCALRSVCSSECDKISSLPVFLFQRKIYTSSHLLQYQVV